jgi:hypothetical protein
MRIRVFVLQAGLIGIFAFGSVLALAMGSFIHGMITDQLTTQQIYFPAAGSKALPAAEFPDLQQYGGQQVNDGVKAQAYANGFIGRHLQSVAGGLTYAQVSAKAQAAPTDTKIAGQVATMFKGETLRGLLLNTYGWWTAGTYATYAGIGLAVATGAILLALLVEIFLAVKAGETAKTVVAPATRLARQV